MAPQNSRLLFLYLLQNKGMFKKIFIHAVVASVLATTAALIYNRIYFFATETDFSKVINAGSIVGLNVFACFIAAFIYWGLLRWLKKKGEVIFNFVFSIASFACVAIPGYIYSAP